MILEGLRPRLGRWRTAARVCDSSIKFSLAGSLESRGARVARVPREANIHVRALKSSHDSQAGARVRNDLTVKPPVDDARVSIHNHMDDRRLSGFVAAMTTAPPVSSLCSNRGVFYTSLPTRHGPRRTEGHGEFANYDQPTRRSETPSAFVAC
jgi:hypothetical protein